MEASLTIIFFLVFFWFVGFSLFKIIRDERGKGNKDILVAASVPVAPDQISFAKKVPKIYIKKQYFLTRSEERFYQVLYQLVGSDYLLFPQVNLGSLVEVCAPHYLTYKYRNAVNRKVLDYGIFSKIDFSPLLIIELDDRSHSLLHRIGRDNVVDTVLKEVGIPILHIRIYEMNNFELLREKIGRVIRLDNYSEKAPAVLGVSKV